MRVEGRIYLVTNVPLLDPDTWAAENNFTRRFLYQTRLEDLFTSQPQFHFDLIALLLF